jgi:hypothetical protein
MMTGALPIDQNSAGPLPPSRALPHHLSDPDVFHRVQTSAPFHAGAIVCAVADRPSILHRLTRLIRMFSAGCKCVRAGRPTIRARRQPGCSPRGANVCVAQSLQAGTPGQRDRRTRVQRCARPAGVQTSARTGTSPAAHAPDPDVFHGVQMCAQMPSGLRRMFPARMFSSGCKRVREPSIPHRLRCSIRTFSTGCNFLRGCRPAYASPGDPGKGSCSGPPPPAPAAGPQPRRQQPDQQYRQTARQHPCRERRMIDVARRRSHGTRQVTDSAICSPLTCVTARGNI